MQHHQPQGSTFLVRAHPHCGLQAADLCALAGLVPATRGDLKVPNPTSFSVRRRHRSVAAP
jgi:hypothetical protein